MNVAILLLQIAVLAATCYLAYRHLRPRRDALPREAPETVTVADADALVARIDDACLRLDARIARAEDILDRLRAARADESVTPGRTEAILDPARDDFARAWAALVQNPRKRKND